MNYYRTRLIDKKFGKLKVIKFSHINESKQVVWECLCDCGKTTFARSDSLQRKHKRSCGCLQYLRGKSNPTYRGIGELSLTKYNYFKRNAIYRNIKFNVSMKYLWELFLKQNRICPLSGRTMNLPTMRNEKSNASLDRIDSKVGYIEDNVQWVDKDVNFAKQSLSDNEFIKLCEDVVTFQSK